MPVSFDNLLSGLLGAVSGSVIGGWLSYVGAVRVFRKEMVFRRSERQKSVRDALRAEVDWYRELINGPNFGLRREGLTPHFWRRARARSDFLGEEFNRKLLELYLALRMYQAAFAKIPDGTLAKQESEPYLDKAKSYLDELAVMLKDGNA